MDALKAVQTYIIKMLDEVSGMKVLLMDAHTVRPLNLITFNLSQS
jgi:vacuolar protein sorting-associated protein 45